MKCSPYRSKASLISSRTQRHAYSNSGYFLLGFIVEKVTGKPYQEALKERITSKIGLKDTYLGTGNIDVNKNEALTYRYIGGLETGTRNPSQHSRRRGRDCFDAERHGQIHPGAV